MVKGLVEEKLAEAEIASNKMVNQLGANSTDRITIANPDPSKNATTPAESDFLFLGDKLLELPHLKPISKCPISNHPVKSRMYPVTGLVDGKIMTCGGKENNRVPRSCFTLDRGRWSKSRTKTDMIHSRFFAAASTTKDGNMMVSGGWDSVYSFANRLDSTEIFVNGKWKVGPTLPMKTSSHCQLFSSLGVIVAGTDFDNEDKFRVFRLEGRNWTQLTEMNWTNRYGHSCQLVQNEKVVVLGGYEHKQRVDIFDLATLTWSKGPGLPIEIAYDFSVNYKNTVYVIRQETGEVYSLSDSLDGDWIETANLGELPRRPVFPAPIVKRKNVCYK